MTGVVEVEPFFSIVKYSGLFQKRFDIARITFFISNRQWFDYIERFFCETGEYDMFWATSCSCRYPNISSEEQEVPIMRRNDNRASIESASTYTTGTRMTCGSFVGKQLFFLLMRCSGCIHLQTDCFRRRCRHEACVFVCCCCGSGIDNNRIHRISLQEFPDFQNQTFELLHLPSLCRLLRYQIPDLPCK